MRRASLWALAVVLLLSTASRAEAFSYGPALDPATRALRDAGLGAAAAVLGACIGAPERLMAGLDVANILTKYRDDALKAAQAEVPGAKVGGRRAVVHPPSYMGAQLRAPASSTQQPSLAPHLRC